MMDYYNILGVPRDADQDTIKKAFRKLAMQHHPDKGGDPAEFQKINEAYNTLSDTDKRFQYDNPQARPQGFPGGFNANMNGFDINDLFNQIFGHRQYQQRHQQIFRTRVGITLRDSYQGCDHVINLNTQQGPKVATLKVPKGIQTGDQIRYDNVLDDASLIVEFLVTKDLQFDRSGDDLYSNLPISVLDLIVGTNIKFKTISGKTLDVTINPNTQPNQHIRIGGHGMPIADSGHYGDQILLLKPFIPANVHHEVIEAIKRNHTN